MAMRIAHVQLDFARVRLVAEQDARLVDHLDADRDEPLALDDLMSHMPSASSSIAARDAAIVQARAVAVVTRYRLLAVVARGDALRAGVSGGIFPSGGSRRTRPARLRDFVDVAELRRQRFRGSPDRNGALSIAAFWMISSVPGKMSARVLPSDRTAVRRACPAHPCSWCPGGPGRPGITGRRMAPAPSQVRAPAPSQSSSPLPRTRRPSQP
jgi:hypothetical protein